MRRTVSTKEDAKSVSMRMEAKDWYAYAKSFTGIKLLTAIGAKVLYFGQFADDQSYSGTNLATEARQ